VSLLSHNRWVLGSNCWVSSW